MREALAGRFRDETKLLYRLSQVNLDIVRCIGSGTLIAPTTKEYTPYMVLEWLDGCTLSADLRERRAQGVRPRSLEAAIALLDPAVGGLAYAHAHDVVHRDVKPGNLFLTRTREGVRMKVLDFGLAKILSDESIGVRPSVETGVGVHFCSPSYGAPEQFSSTLGKIGPWTDVYSLTLVLYEILVGDKVRQAGSLAEGLLKAIDPKTGSPSTTSLGLHVPKAVEEMLLRAVAQNPLDRPRDAGVFWGELKQAVLSAPKTNVGAATVMDNAVGQAMHEVRAAVARGSVPPAAPFTGTMLMLNAPTGAAHLGPPGFGAPAPARIPAPVPAAGRPPETVGAAQPTEQLPVVSRTTAPLRPPADGLKGTLAMGAVSPFAGMSPLAASMAMQSGARPMVTQPTPASAYSVPPPPQPQSQLPPQPQSQLPPQPQPQAQTPQTQPIPAQPQLAQQAQPQPQAHQAQQAQQAQHAQQSQEPQAQQLQDQQAQHMKEQQAQQRRTDPRMGSLPPPALPMKSNAGGVIFIVVCLVLAIAGGAFYFFRMRGN